MDKNLISEPFTALAMNLTKSKSFKVQLKEQTDKKMEINLTISFVSIQPDKS